MSLNWQVSDIKDFENLCWIADPESETTKKEVTA